VHSSLHSKYAAVGSAVFSKLLNYKKQYPITALSRSDEKVELLNKLRDNVKGLKGSLDDLDLVEEQASKHDIIFNTADADHVSYDLRAFLICHG
jgi:dihydrodipicolinate synthase/N-acetylneuraminate lyase